MSAQANVVLVNGSAANKTFAPKGALRSPTGKDVAEWREQSAAVADGFYTLTEQHSDPNANGLEKFRWVLEIPTLQTVGTNDAGITPPPKRAYANTMVLEAWVSTQATQTELDDIVAMMSTFAASAYVENAVKAREHAW